MQTIKNVSSHPTGEPPGTPDAKNQTLSTPQRTVLESLVTRIVAQGLQQPAEVWADLRHELKLQPDGELQRHHVPAAERWLTARLNTTRSGHDERQTLAQLAALLDQGNNRQAVSDYIRQQFGQTALNQLTAKQCAEVLHLLQAGELAIPQPRQRLQTDRPLLPAEHNALNQAVSKLAATTGEPARQIWQSMLELTGVKEGELITACYYTPLSTWLTARLTLAPFPTVTVKQLLSALKQPLEDDEWHKLRDARNDSAPLTRQSLLNSEQAVELLSQLVLMRTGQPIAALQPQQIQPLWRPASAPLRQHYRALTVRFGIFLLLVLGLLAAGWLIAR